MRWHKIDSHSHGADSGTAPLLISGIKLRSYWKGIPVEVENLKGKLDTGAVMTVIPIRIAVSMKLLSAGFEKKIQTFDYSLGSRQYAKFHTEIYLPNLGWASAQVIGCEREGILLGRDICEKMLLVANWRSEKFGLRRADMLDQPLSLVFSRFLKRKSK